MIEGSGPVPIVGAARIIRHEKRPKGHFALGVRILYAE
jgi:hypothetical protein